MTAGSRRRRMVADAIFADEIGIEYAVHEDFRLRSTYQPIFAPRGELLRMVAVEAAVEAHHRGCSVSPAIFLDAVLPGERPFVDALCRTLHLRNFRNIGLDGLKLFFGFDLDVNDGAGRTVSELRLMAGRLDELGLHPGQVMCQVAGGHADEPGLLCEVAYEMRASGLGVVLSGFGTGHESEQQVDVIRPHVVRVDGPLFALLCSYPAAGHLFGRLVSMLQDAGVEVLVEGIETARQLRVALEAGADLLQGLLLARPLAAGAFFDESPLVIDRLLPRADAAMALRPDRGR